MSARACRTAMAATLLTFLLVPTSGRSPTLKVATYNLWNIMFNWDVRKYHIASMIQEADLDVVAFQEVRADLDEEHSQLLELKSLLPSYKWYVYRSSQRVTPFKGAPTGWEMEGLGLLSRHPIVTSITQPLTHQSPKDKNKRLILHASLRLDLINVSISVAHFSYDHWQQCVNVAEMMKHIRASRPANSIIMGDLNTYVDYPWPLEGLLYGYFSTSNKCPKYAAQKNPTTEEELMSYLDAWAEVNPHRNGFTFSNMPQPGFQSRPDRILLSSKSWSVVSCSTIGLGKGYANRYTKHIIWSRLATVLNSSKSLFYNTPSSRGCLHDCGPHGSCRCGVCVSGGNRNNCELPNCPECSSNAYRNCLVVLLLLSVLFAQILVATVLLIKQLRVARRRPFSRCLRACFCQALRGKPPVSFLPQVSYSRQSAVAVLMHILCPLCHLRPICQIFIYCVCTVLLMLFCYLYLFEDSLRTIYAILPEELNPSDHLMVQSAIILKN
ncbi:uncharacterized protein LOC117307090 isoform X1 [Asterias rubens]|uniref:uncharacterized protein LOC117307090 isoform X1 n=1 Tax=Asterias rubens TaxID=7604 RepID=UPI0014551A59|nr:uncharacterized protein LOC117307090 isoform X1 [Asterias rubens]